jgi:hypothetical protein
MLTTATLEKTLSLLDEGYTFASITEETGITTEDAEAGRLHDSLMATPDEAAMWGVFVAGSPSHSLTANRDESASARSHGADPPDHEVPPGGRI